MCNNHIDQYDKVIAAFEWFINTHNPEGTMTEYAAAQTVLESLRKREAISFMPGQPASEAAHDIMHRKIDHKKPEEARHFMALAKVMGTILTARVLPSPQPAGMAL